MNEIIQVLLDDDTCIATLKAAGLHKLLEELPVAAMSAPAGQASVAFSEAYNPVEQRGLFIVFYGSGCDENDRGWAITIFRASTEEYFDQKIKKMRAGLEEVAKDSFLQ